MKLYDQRWVSAARRAVKKLVQANPEWRKEARARRWKRHRPTQGWIFRPLITLSLVFATVLLSPGTGEFLLLLWALIPLLYRVWELQRKLVYDENAASFATFPVTDDWLYRFQTTPVWRGSIWFACDAAAVYGVAAWAKGGSPAAYAVALVAAAAQWGSSLGAALLLFRLFPQVRFGRLLSGWWFVLLGLLVVVRTSPNLAPTFWAAIERAMSLATPAGWVQSALAMARRDEAGGLFFALPVVALSSAVPRLWRDLRREYRYLERAPDWGDRRIAHPPAGEEEDEAAGDTEVARIHAASQAEAVRSIEALTWLQQDTVPRGALSRWILTRVLDERERRVLSFLLPLGESWGRSQIIAWKVAGYVALAMLVLIRIWPKDGLAIPFAFMIWITINLAVPIFGGSWAGFAAIGIAQRRASFNSLWPLSFAEQARLMWKVNTMRVVAGLPLCLAMGAFTGWIFAATPVWGAYGGVKTWLVLLAIQPLTVIFPFAAQTTDTHGWRGSLLWLVLMGPIGLPILAATFYLYADLYRGLLAPPFIMLLAWLGGRWYRRALERGWFDLLSAQQ